VLECVVNLSEGTERVRLDAFRDACGPVLLDLHTDRWHNRSVFTLAGPDEALHGALRRLTTRAVELLDLGGHDGVHPRLGVVDVVPFVDLAGPPHATAASLAGRARYAAWASVELGLPCFLYGPERTLPEIRRAAWRTLGPDLGPDRPHPTAGAVCVGARGPLVAFNLVLDRPDLAAARAAAAAVRGRDLRALGLAVGPDVQVSCNLTSPHRLGPDAAFDAVAAVLARGGPAAPRIRRAELVGLVPAALLDRVPPARWPQLDLGPDRTIEAALARAGGG